MQLKPIEENYVFLPFLRKTDKIFLILMSKESNESYESNKNLLQN